MAVRKGGLGEGARSRIVDQSTNDITLAGSGNLPYSSRMFKAIRELSACLHLLVEVHQDLSVHVKHILETWTEEGTLRERVLALEQTIHVERAEAEAIAIEAESRFKAARSAEERARHILKTAEAATAKLGEGDEEGTDRAIERYLDLQESDDRGSEDNGVQPVPPPVGVLSSREVEKANARQLKGF